MNRYTVCLWYYQAGGLGEKKSQKASQEVVMERRLGNTAFRRITTLSLHRTS